VLAKSHTRTRVCVHVRVTKRPNVGRPETREARDSVSCACSTRGGRMRTSEHARLKFYFFFLFSFFSLFRFGKVGRACVLCASTRNPVAGRDKKTNRSDRNARDPLRPYYDVKSARSENGTYRRRRRYRYYCCRRRTCSRTEFVRSVSRYDRVTQVRTLYTTQYRPPCSPPRALLFPSAAAFTAELFGRF